MSTLRIMQVAPHRRDRAAGFTIIELMVVVAIVAIVAVIAVPAYTEHVARARRGDGMDALMNTAHRLERCYTQYGTYTDAACGVALPLTSPEGYYSISANPLNATDFTLEAAPQNAQADDKCETLTLTHTGVRGTTSALDCW